MFLFKWQMWHIITLLNSLPFMYELCHEKTDLKVLVVVIHQQGISTIAEPIRLVV